VQTPRNRRESAYDVQAVPARGARNTILFLAGWEVMALAAFLTITTEDEERPVREVGYLYLVATRVSTLAMFAMFALLFGATGAFDFDAGGCRGRG
jgi:formate hydrogenlyase subunit 3/multisubunit Na+/H+ antiporter MnhD subunit